MVIENLQFFDSNGYNLNFDWNESGYWEGYIYLPKVSVGLYANTSIYVLEKISNANSNDEVFNNEYFFPTGTGKITFSWDRLNKFVDEFFMFDFDDTYTIKETSSLTYTPNDGPDCETLIVNRFDTYDVPLDNTLSSKALPIHVAFMANEKYDATTYNRTLVMSYGRQTVAKIKFFAETVEEDERLKIWNSNLGYNITPEDEMIFYKSDIKEYMPDYQLLNEKRKELMMEGSNIYPYIGSYKAIINAIKFFGYDNLNIIEYWKNVNPDDVNFGKIYHSSKYSLTKKETLTIGARNIVLPNKDYKKVNALALVYSINKPTQELDEWELPKVEEQFKYTIEEAIIKLFALRKKLNKEFMPGTSRIIDIIGEANYFGIHGITKIHEHSELEVANNEFDLDFEISPSKYLHITDNEYFNRYITVKKHYMNPNEEIPYRDRLLSDMNDITLNDILTVDDHSSYTPQGSDRSTSIPEELETLTNYQKCEWFKKYYQEVFVDYTLNKSIENNDDYPYDNPYYTYTEDPLSRFTAKVVLTNTTFDGISFGECDLKFECKDYPYVEGQGNDTPRIDFEHPDTIGVTFGDIDQVCYPELISWKITMSSDQYDEDLKNIGVIKEYQWHDLEQLDNTIYSTNKRFEKTYEWRFKKNSNLDEVGYEQFFVELPYVGYYDVTMELKYNGSTTSQKKTKTKCIKVEPYNIDIIGFYYDARNLPKNIQYELPEGSQMYNFIKNNIEQMHGFAAAERATLDIEKDFSMPYDGSGNLIGTGPYASGNIDNEWYLADNLTVEMAELKPLVKYTRYIRSGVDVKPYTWFLLGYEYSKITGKVKPKWTITNNAKNAPYVGPNGNWFIDDKDTGIVVGIDTPVAGQNGNWIIGNKDTKIRATSVTKYFEGNYLTMLLKKEGNYTVTLTLEDKNGNSYSISRNIFVVSKTANYKLYQTFKKDYDYYLEQMVSKELNEFVAYKTTPPIG